MPKLIKEITSGTSFSRSRENGAIADSQNRVFRVILDTPGEVFDIQEKCGVAIGDTHPYNTNIYCQSFSAQFEGDSRMTILCTFQYAPNVMADNNEEPQPPDIRPATWSIASSLVEVPAWHWWPEDGPNAGKSTPPQNAAGDTFEGITKLEPLITISVTQFETEDPMYRMLDAGKINSDELQIGSLTIAPRTMMFRGVARRPAVESFGSSIFVGYSASYEFLYKRNYVGAGVDEEIGWDIAVPQTGLNVITFNPQQPGNNPALMDADPLGQPLQWAQGSDGFGTSVALPYKLPKGLAAGKRAPAMVAVPSHADGGMSQSPAAMPIPLNFDGTPRSASAKPPVEVNRYRLYEEISFADFGLRIQ